MGVFTTGEPEFVKLRNLLVNYCREGEQEFIALLNLLVNYCKAGEFIKLLDLLGKHLLNVFLRCFGNVFVFFQVVFK